MNALKSSSRQQGVALIIVLTMLVLLSALLVGFMSTATTELGATQSASAGSTARQIADSTVNLVVGQLREATTQADDKTTWASQPGAVRTYSGSVTTAKRQIKDGATYNEYTGGSNDYVYKLYSSDRMKVSSSDYSSRDLPDEVSVIEKWKENKPQEYVDLNEPLIQARLDVDPKGTVVEPHYPIIDPRARFTASGGTSTSASTPAIVEGFDAKLDSDNNRSLADTKAGLPFLPMPVKWLYVMRDGTVGSASQGTKENPIIGRTAFWADDETCKLNINTASEGTFWDTPSVSTEQEAGNIDSSQNLNSSARSLSLAVASPTAGEYQRYGGHPYTTCLSPVFGWMWGLSPQMSLYPTANPAYTSFKEAIYKIAPFTPYGSQTTVGATVNADPQMPFDGSRPKQNVATKRLYATVDELMFKSNRNTGGTSPNSDLNDFSTQFTPAALEKTRFFLTASSRAPELNLYGRPKVTIWPVAEDPKLRTHYDDLFAFTSTLARTANETNDKRFYLTRKDAKSASNDFSTQNQTMYQYLQQLTAKPVPGFGGTFSTKYGIPAIRDQILTNIFDYVRTVNLVDTGTASRVGNVFVPYTPRFYPENLNATYSRVSRAIDWSGQVTPLKVTMNGTATMGMGRFVTISEAALLFYKLPGSTAATDQLQAMLLLEMSTTMPGYPAIKDTYWTRVYIPPGNGVPMQITMLSAAGVAGAPVNAELCTQNASTTDLGLVNINNVAAHEVTDGRGFMPILGFTSGMHYFPRNPGPLQHEKFQKAELDPNFRQTGSANPGIKTFNWPNPASTSVPLKSNIGASGFNSSPDDAIKNYPYVSKPIPISGASFFSFSRTVMSVDINVGQDPRDPRSALVQTVNLEFPDVAKLPIPTSGSFVGRLNGSLDGNWNCIQGGDVVRSIEFTGPPSSLPQRGDLRLAASLPVIPTNFFMPRDTDASGNFTIYKSTQQQVHGLQCSHGEPVNGHTQTLSGKSNNPGTLVPGGDNRNVKPPIIPRYITGVQNQTGGPGDWDRGLSKHMDGAFSNKVDEGNMKFDMAASGSSRLPYFRGRGIEETGQSFFTPNRQLPSAVMLGSIPTGINPIQPQQSKPWQTLLFRPDRQTSGVHPGSALPQDHLWLEMFHVPIVEPYAISEPFSTAGKVNMNYVIAPFGYAKGEAGNNPGGTVPRSYVRRDTALRGVLRSVWMMAVPNNASEMGHPEAYNSNIYRYPIDLDRTLDELEIRLNNQQQAVSSRTGPLFRSPSEICDIDLYPATSPNGGPIAPPVTNWPTFWNGNLATGDNLRERPYAMIYPRLTTKSNVFTVHMRCQVIRKSPTSKANEFDPVKDQIAGEYRGSSVVERFIDPNDKDLQNYDAVNEKVDPYYRFRVVSTKQFTAH